MRGQTFNFLKLKLLQVFLPNFVVLTCSLLLFQTFKYTGFKDLVKNGEN